MKQNDWMTGKPAVRHRPCLREFTQLTVFVLPDSRRLKQRYAHFTIWPKLLWDLCECERHTFLSIREREGVARDEGCFNSYGAISHVKLWIDGSAKQNLSQEERCFSPDGEILIWFLRSRADMEM